MAYWVLPAFIASIGAGPAQLGIIEGVAESVASIAKLFSGYLADRVSRRRDSNGEGPGRLSFGNKRYQQLYDQARAAQKNGNLAEAITGVRGVRSSCESMARN